jgi:hypothetical protein
MDDFDNDNSEQIDLCAEELMDNFLDFVEQSGVQSGIVIEDIKEVLALFQPDQLEFFMSSDFSRGFILGSMLETTVMADDDQNQTTH